MSRREKTAYYFSGIHSISPRDRGKYTVQPREGSVWDRVERREWEGRAEGLAAARGPVMSDLHPWVLWLALAYCEGLHLHCRKKKGCWVWNKQDNMVSRLQININLHYTIGVNCCSYSFIFKTQWNHADFNSHELWVALIWTSRENYGMRSCLGNMAP